MVNDDGDGDEMMGMVTTMMMVTMMRVQGLVVQRPLRGLQPERRLAARLPLPAPRQRHQRHLLEVLALQESILHLLGLQDPDRAPAQCQPAQHDDNDVYHNHHDPYQ